jgi:HAD superfamily hydrolase (TIGR01509 family)
MNKLNPNRINTLLFDFDGVIADTENSRYEAYCDIFREYGYDMRSRCKVNDLAGFVGDSFAKKYFPEIPPEIIKEIVSKRQAFYMAHLDRFCKPYPGMRQTIIDLKGQNYCLALTTSNLTAVAKKLLEAVDVRDYFDVVFGREFCENPETKVKDYSRIPGLMNKSTEECVVIEDSPVGVTGAKRSGFYCIAFEHFEDPLIARQADAIIHNYNDLRKLFDLPPLDLEHKK